jgi:hypothetical protein
MGGRKGVRYPPVTLTTGWNSPARRFVCRAMAAESVPQPKILLAAAETAGAEEDR